MQEQLNTPTLRETFASYLAIKNLKPKSIKVYQQVFSTSLSTLQDSPLDCITQEQVIALHKSLKPYSANIAMRLLRALFLFADYPSPTQVLTKHRIWNKEKRRKTVLTASPSGSLHQFFKGANALNNIDLRDYLLFLLFTGLRKGEAQNLRWKAVDLKAETIRLDGSKNGESPTLPVNHQALAILAARNTSQRPLVNDLVFGLGCSAGSKCLVRVGVEFCLHDLRRTFITSADYLDIPMTVTKQLVNHKGADVTDGYVVRSLEKLRKASQTIGDYLETHQRLT